MHSCKFIYVLSVLLFCLLMLAHMYTEHKATHVIWKVDFSSVFYEQLDKIIPSSSASVIKRCIATLHSEEK